MSFKLSTLLVASTLFFAPAVWAAEYTVDPATSKIAFTGEQAGTKFEGVFETWTAKVDFDPAKLDTSTITVDITTASAKTGNAMYDGTLPKDDWFDAEKFPMATFKSTSITAVKDGAYIAAGDLTIKNVTKPISFQFTLDETKEPEVQATSQFNVDRLVYGLGVKSDGKAEWVSKDIVIALDIHAKKAH